MSDVPLNQAADVSKPLALKAIFRRMTAKTNPSDDAVESKPGEVVATSPTGDAPKSGELTRYVDEYSKINYIARRRRVLG